MTFLRLRGWDWLAFVAALALLLVMAVDWYSTEQGEECRRVESVQTPAGGVQGQQIGESVRRDARECAEAREKNAFQAPAAIDRVIMLVLLLAILTAVAAAFLRAADRRFEPPLTPSTIAAGAGLVAALLVLYRILQPPGFNEAAVVKAGAPLGLALVGVLAVGARFASVAEREGPKEETQEPEDAAPAASGADGQEAAPVASEPDAAAPEPDSAPAEPEAAAAEPAPAEGAPSWEVDEEEVTFEVPSDPDPPDGEPPRES